MHIERLLSPKATFDIQLDGSLKQICHGEKKCDGYYI